MREIKFRAWDKENKQMADVRAWDFAHGFCELKHDVKDDCPDEEQLEIMQYTGLKDKNGKEIYEGDVVENDIGLKVVKIGFSTYTDPDGYEHNFHGVYGTWTDGTESYFQKNDSDIEVIGNIYENPELLREYCG